jgi:hypothetical protein
MFSSEMQFTHFLIFIRQCGLFKMHNKLSLAALPIFWVGKGRSDASTIPKKEGSIFNRSFIIN